MSDVTFCRFCGQEHGIELRPGRAPCPKVRALKFEPDGTMMFFKLRGVKGWQHKSKLKADVRWLWKDGTSAPFPSGLTITAKLPGFIAIPQDLPKLIEAGE